MASRWKGPCDEDEEEQLPGPPLCEVSLHTPHVHEMANLFSGLFLSSCWDVEMERAFLAIYYFVIKMLVIGCLRYISLSFSLFRLYLSASVVKSTFSAPQFLSLPVSTLPMSSLAPISSSPLTSHFCHLFSSYHSLFCSDYHSHEIVSDQPKLVTGRCFVELSDVTTCQWTRHTIGGI